MNIYFRLIIQEYFIWDLACSSFGHWELLARGVIYPFDTWAAVYVYMCLEHLLNSETISIRE